MYIFKIFEAKKSLKKKAKKVFYTSIFEQKNL